MGIFKPPRRQSKIGRRFKIGRPNDKFWKIQKENRNVGRPKIRTSTPRHPVFRTKRKSLSFTPIKSPLRKRIRYTPSKTTRKVISPNPRCTIPTVNQMNLDDTWEYPLQESTPDRKEDRNEDHSVSEKKIVKRTLTYQTERKEDTQKDSTELMSNDESELKGCEVNSVEHVSEVENLQEILKEVIKTMEEHCLGTEFIGFLKLVANKKFPLDNVAFLLFIDVVKFFCTDDIRAIRYSETTMKFFWLGKKLFGGRFIRFLTGPKNEGDKLFGHVHLSPDNSRINFAGPSEVNLSNYNPLGFEIDAGNSPGLIEHMIDKVAEQNTKDKTYVLMFDGKKIKRGADVDLLGLEEPHLKQQQEKFSADSEVVESALKNMKVINEQIEAVGEVTPGMKSSLSSTLLDTFRVISVRLMELRKLKVSKGLALQRYRERIKKDPSLAKSLEYAIDSCRTASYRIDNCIDVFMKAQWEICRCESFHNNLLHLFAKDTVVNDECPENAVMLKEVDEMKVAYGSEEIPTRFIKQRSEEWYNARKEVKVTGSSVYGAVGCETLQRQKEHFDKTVLQKTPKPFTEEQTFAMNHGVESEKHQIANLAQVIIPFMFPDLLYHEEGYYKENGVIVSPDGSIRNKKGEVVYAFEGKAPIGNKFSTKQHYRVPERYITQTLYEDRVLKAEKGTLYMCWTGESSTVFRVPKDESIIDMSTNIINDLYHSEPPKRPTRLSKNSKQLKSKLKEHVDKCEFIGEFPSIEVKQANGDALSPNEIGKMDKKYSLVQQTQTRQDSVATYSYDNINKVLLKVKDAMNDCYNLQRKWASQVLVFLLSDLDRTWKSEMPHAVPIMYCFRGYSLSMDVVRQLTEQCINACAKKGIQIAATSSDGEFISLMVKNKKGGPLTLNQLNKVVWSQVCKLKKTELVGKLKELNKSHSIETDDEGKVFLISDGHCFKQVTTENGWRHLKRRNKSKKAQGSESENEESNESKDVTNSIQGSRNETAYSSNNEESKNSGLTVSDKMETEIELDGHVAKGETINLQNEQELQSEIELNVDYHVDRVTEEVMIADSELDESEVPVNSNEYGRRKYIYTKDEEEFIEDIEYTNSSQNEPNENESDMDKTLPYEFESAVFELNELSSNQSNEHEISEAEASDILNLFRTLNQRKWRSTNTSRIKTIMKKSLHNLTKDELRELSEYYKVKVQAKETRKVLKNDYIKSMSEFFGTTTTMKLPKRPYKKRQPKSLSELASKALLKSSYPKEALNVVYASYIWPARVQEWKNKGKVASKLEIKGENESIYFEPYYIPDYDEDNQRFRVFTYDKTHLGTNLRKCLCLDKVKGISIKAWNSVSESKPSVLHPSIVKVSDEGKIMDQMKEQLARTMVSEGVESEMQALGFIKEAEFCNVIREGLYRADDTPGIPALQRCRNRIRLMKWLDEDVDFGTFPPYGAYVKGMSHILYEGLRSSLDAKIYLYELSKTRSYNARAPNTLCSESFFGTMQDMDPWGQGILSADGVKKHMTDFTTITSLKMDTTRNIFVKTKKDAVYPSPEKSNSSHGDERVILQDTDDRQSPVISTIIPRDHFFDSAERARLYKGEKLYHPSTSDVVRGELPIRAQYGYKIREDSMMPSERLNVKFLSDDSNDFFDKKDA